MPKTVTPLTDTQIKNAKTDDKELALQDGNGLMLRVRKTGAKDWIHRYTHPTTGKRVKMALGSYPAVGLKGARNERDTNNELLAQDVDPKDHRKAIQAQAKQAAGQTLEAVMLNWLEVKKTKVTADFAVDIKRSLELHILPKLGHLPISKINAPDTIEILKPVAASGRLETIKRVCGRLNEIMTFAVNTGVIHHNPLTGIREAFAKPVKQHQPTIYPDQLPNLMQTLHRARISPVTRCLIEWQLHTMTRPSEAAGARWEEIDLAAMTWTIPAERMKRKREHIIPLTDSTAALLEVMRPISGHHEHVFTGERKQGSHINSETANVALKRMGFKGVLTSHGMRSIASTALNEAGFDSQLIEFCLAHVGKDEVKNAYDKSTKENLRRPLMDWWSNLIEQAATGSVSLTGVNVTNVVNISHGKAGTA